MGEFCKKLLKIFASMLIAFLPALAVVQPVWAKRKWHPILCEVNALLFLVRPKPLSE